MPQIEKIFYFLILRILRSRHAPDRDMPQIETCLKSRPQTADRRPQTADRRPLHPLGIVQDFRQLFRNVCAQGEAGRTRVDVQQG